MKIIQYKPVGKAPTLGFISVVVPEWNNLTIYNITHFSKDGREWISFPCKTYEKDGQTKYFSYLRLEKDDMVKFQAQVFEALKVYQANGEPKPQARTVPEKTKYTPREYEPQMDGLPF